MSFFDGLGKKFNNLNDSVRATTKDFSETQQLKKRITQEQNEIERIYRELGCAYYEAHETDVNCEFWKQIEALNQARQNIKTYNQEIEQIQTEAEIRKAEAEERKAEAKAEAEARRAEAKAMAEARKTEAEAKKAAEAVQMEEEKKNCPSCNYPNDIDAAFCEQCGTRLPEMIKEPEVLIEEPEVPIEEPAVSIEEPEVLSEESFVEEEKKIPSEEQFPDNRENEIL